MAITVQLYDSFRKRKLDESPVISLIGGTVRLILTTSGYTPLASHIYRSSITNEVANGHGYATNGKVLTGKVVGTSGALVYFDANDVAWANATFTARRGVLLVDATPTKNSLLVGWIDFGANRTASGGTFTVRWAAPASGAIISLA